MTRYSHLKRKSLAIYDTAHSDCKRSLQPPSHLHTSHMCPRHFSCRYFSTWLILNQIEFLIRTSTSSPYPVKNASPSCHWSFVVLVSADDHFHTGGLNSCFWRRSTATAIFFFFLLFERVQLRVITPMLGTERGHSNMTDLSRVRIIPLYQWYSTSKYWHLQSDVPFLHMYNRRSSYYDTLKKNT